MIYIGCDPGISGAFFAIGSMGTSSLVMPAIPVQMTTKTKSGNLKTKNIINGAAVRQWLWQFYPQRQDVEICIELVGPMPDQGAVAGFSFGESFGLLKGIIIGMGFRWCQVRPQAWKKVLMAGRPKWSEAIVAAEIFPVQDWRATERCSTPHSGLVDAALIATWLKRMRSNVALLDRSNLPLA